MRARRRAGYVIARLIGPSLGPRQAGDGKPAGARPLGDETLPRVHEMAPRLNETFIYVAQLGQQRRPAMTLTHLLAFAGTALIVLLPLCLPMPRRADTD